MDDRRTLKRKIQIEDASRPAAKIQKLSNDVRSFDYSELPPEILLEIFDYLKPEDDCMKELSRVCSLFQRICSPRLRVLRLDFGKIIASKRYPVIKRGYEEIRMFGKEIDCNRVAIGQVLASSRETARKLVISVNATKRCQIKMRTLMFILRSLPNLQEVAMVKVQGLMPQISSKAIEASELPKLAFLKTLTMKDVSAQTFQAFKATRSIEEFDLNLTFKSNSEKDLYNQIIGQQLKLLKFRSFARRCRGNIGFENLQAFDAEIGVGQVEHLLTNNPKLESIKIWPQGPQFLTFGTLTAGPPVTALKKFAFMGLCAANFNINQILTKFPLLESFWSYNEQWSKPLTA